MAYLGVVSVLKAQMQLNKYITSYISFKVAVGITFITILILLSR